MAAEHRMSPNVKESTSTSHERISWRGSCLWWTHPTRVAPWSFHVKAMLTIFSQSTSVFTPSAPMRIYRYTFHRHNFIVNHTSKCNHVFLVRLLTSFSLMTAHRSSTLRTPTSSQRNTKFCETESKSSSRSCRCIKLSSKRKSHYIALFLFACNFVNMWWISIFERIKKRARLSSVVWTSLLGSLFKNFVNSSNLLK